MRREFETLVHEYQHRVFNFACYCVGNRDDAQDVTQEVLLKLWRNLEKLEPAGVWPWLIRVTRNASIDAHRKRGSYRAVVREDPEGEATDRMWSSTPAPDASVERADFSRQLQVALNEIREPYRSIVVLREIEDLKYEEIAAALELPLNTVKVYLHRGRRMLRQRLREYVDHET